jgi:hypothetical protein
VVEPTLERAAQRRPGVVLAGELVVAPGQVVEHVGADMRWVGRPAARAVPGATRQHRVDDCRQGVAGARAADLPHHIPLAEPCPLVELGREWLQTWPVLEVTLIERVGQGVGGECVDVRNDDFAGRDRLGHIGSLRGSAPTPRAPYPRAFAAACAMRHHRAVTSITKLHTKEHRSRG